MCWGVVRWSCPLPSLVVWTIPQTKNIATLYQLPQLENLTLNFSRPHCGLELGGTTPYVHSWRSILIRECFLGECGRLTSYWFSKTQILGLTYYLLASQPTSQPMNNFPNRVAIFIKRVDSQSSNGVQLQKRVVGNIFLYSKENRTKS